MILKITDTGISMNQELIDYIDQRFEGIYFNEINIDLYTFDDEQQGLEFMEKEVSVTYPGPGPFLKNTLCILEQDINQNIINWLKSL